MCYYDSWFEENWCEEPREEETALIEAIKEGVRQDIKAEMERLRKENTELQQYKQERQEYEYRLQTEVEAYKRTLRQGKVKELFGDYIGTGWGVGRNTILPPKCDKCDEKRFIHFKSPRGKELTELCDCAFGKMVCKPIELTLIKFSKYRDEIIRYFIDRDHTTENYWEYEDATSNIYDGKTPFEDLNCWEIVFLDKETCERYCAWKTEQEAKKNGN